MFLYLSNIILNVIYNRNLVNLKCRIDELHNEIDEAKEHFKHLHKQRGVLTKEKEGRMSDIELWSARCNELQLLKFGRVMDLDELEASSDRTKELEAEALLKDDEASYKAKAKKLIKESSAIQEQLAEVKFLFILSLVSFYLSESVVTNLLLLGH